MAEMMAFYYFLNRERGKSIPYRYREKIFVSNKNHSTHLY